MNAPIELSKYDPLAERYRVPIEQIVVKRGIIEDWPSYIKDLEISRKYGVVSDENTSHFLHQKVQRDDAIEIILPGDVKPTVDVVNEVREQLSMCETLVAIGSGTINDICKYASFLDKKDYIVCATAPSMNGYSSANASIIVNGYKATCQAHLPRAIFMDLDILAAAPKRLIQSGIGDLLCRSTSQADWLLSHVLFDTYYDDSPFNWLLEFEDQLFDNSRLLLEKNYELFQLFSQMLLISGFGMYHCQGSYPASQGEHMIAHVMEMVFGTSLPSTYHGEQIGVTTLTMSRLQHNIVDQNKPPTFVSNTKDDFSGRIESFFGKKIGASCIDAYIEKHGMYDDIDVFNDRLHSKWPTICEKVGHIMTDSGCLENVLTGLGASISAKALGWNERQYGEAILHAKFSRNRFTFLDLMTETVQTGKRQHLSAAAKLA